MTERINKNITEENSPANAIRLIVVLGKLGFGDDAFWRLHHFRLKGEREPLGRFLAYCETKSVFQVGGTNSLVCERLRFVLEGYRARSLPPGDFRAMAMLAEEAFKQIPPLG